MNQKNMKLKNISFISPMTFYESKREHYRGTSSQFQYNSGLLYKNASLFNQNSNYQSSSTTKHSKDLKSYSHSKPGRLTRDDSMLNPHLPSIVDQMIKSASSSFSMLNSKSQFNRKRYTNIGLSTESNVKSNNSSSEYQLLTSPSSSSAIGKQQQQPNKSNNSLRNIKVFYSELSKHLTKDYHNSTRNNAERDRDINNVIVNCSMKNANANGKGVGFELPQQRPSTKTTKESNDNSMKSKNNNSRTKAGVQLNKETYRNDALGKYSNLALNKSEINTPEELHYFYVSILQSGKEIEGSFDKRTSEAE